MRNWGGNLNFSTQELVSVESISQLQDLVAKARAVKVMGSRHSFSTIGDTTGTLISLKNLKLDIEIDSAKEEALIPAGALYAQAARYLESKGWAFINLASLTEITIAGAVLSATHGSGDKNGNLSSHVVGIEIVLPSGELLKIDRENSPEFPGFVVSLGALGVITKYRMKIVPSYNAKQYVYDGVTSKSISANFDEIFSSAYSVSFFSTWAPGGSGRVWKKFKDDGSGENMPATLFDGKIATENLHPVRGMDATPCTDQMGVSGKWLERIQHFKLDSTTPEGNEVQTEYFVDRKHVKEYIAGLESIGDRIAPLVFATEIRTMTSDDLWLSGAYGRETVGFHFTWRNVPGVHELLPEIENILGKHGGRPHWSKLFEVNPAALAGRYPMYSKFEDLLAKYDPEKKFRNHFIDRYFKNY